MTVKRHAHEFTALWWHFGPYGPQDVHVHSCYAGCWEGPLPASACDRVLIGAGRECDGVAATHRRQTLAEPVPTESATP